MFSKKLIQLRKEKGFSQEKLADALNVSKQSVYKWERGVNKPDTENLKNISELFNLTVDQLLNNKELNKIRSESSEQNMLTNNQVNNLKKYINMLPLIGIIISVGLTIYLVFILDYSINIPLITYILLPIIVLTLFLYLPYKILEARRN